MEWLTIIERVVAFVSALLAILQLLPFQKSAPRKRFNLFTALLVSVLITTLVMIVTPVGQQFELQAFDQMIRWRQDEGPDKRLLIVTVTPEDLEYQRDMGWERRAESLSDQAIVKVLDKLNDHKPVLIGLDIFRDYPAQDENLKIQLEQNKSLIAVCSETIDPPDEIRENERIGFADFPKDSDDVIRRQFLGMSMSDTSSCSTYSFSLRVASRYLSYLKEKGIPTQNIEFKFKADKFLKINEALFNRLDKDAGGYHLPQSEAQGFQILLNYRSPQKIAETITLKELLDGSLDSKLTDLVKNKIVLIGTVAYEIGNKDMHFTPYNEKIPGVMIHGQMISQILSAVLDGRTLLRWWPQAVENLWVWVWSFIGGILTIFSIRQGLVRSLIWITLVLVAVAITCFVVFIQVGGWLPLVPSILGPFLTGIAMIVYYQIIIKSPK